MAEPPEVEISRQLQDLAGRLLVLQNRISAVEDAIHRITQVGRVIRDLRQANRELLRVVQQNTREIAQLRHRVHFLENRW